MTVEEFIDNHGKPEFVRGDGEPIYSDEEVQQLMIEFAKMHVEKALKAAKDNASLALVRYEGGEVEVINHLGEEVSTEREDEYIVVDTRAILEAYSLENIL